MYIPKLNEIICWLMPHGRGTHFYKDTVNLPAHMSIPAQQVIIQSFLHTLHRGKTETCLDVGSGIGNNVLTLSRYCKNITAVDISEVALKYLTMRYKTQHLQVKTLVEDAHNLSFHTGQFDLVVCTEILEHIEQPMMALRECIRVLRKKGKLLVSTPNYFNAAGLWKITYEHANRGKVWDAWGTHDGGRENFFTSFKLKKYLTNFDGKIVEERGLDFLRAWAPFLRGHYRFLDKNPFISLGKLWPMRYFMMNYFVLFEKNT